MPDQPVSLTARQRDVLALARKVVNEDRDSAAPIELRHAAIRAALRLVLEVFDDDEEPVPHRHPEAYHAPWDGYCTCGGHVQVNSAHDVQFIAAAVTP